MMSGEERGIGVASAIVVIIAILVFLLVQANQRVGDLNKALSQANENISFLNGEIEQANSDMENLNNQMYDAQSAAWSSYYAMGSTLENLNPIEDSFNILPMVSSSTN